MQETLLCLTAIVLLHLATSSSDPFVSQQSSRVRSNVEGLMVRIMVCYGRVSCIIFKCIWSRKCIHESNPNLLPLQQVSYELTGERVIQVVSHLKRHFYQLK
ncbi:hypothetical protein BDV41DRAFT_146185 [Aspergillus transmontanensis]|uniref:Secreted protein n=1 Tax=Aspergillus transmontanensis TaxID=1034304 RepID=A0A5N6VDR3_9EURO|nr:hypothetical protein BDV41DRAFT_146185 [Aspergillus transmontanensis]